MLDQATRERLKQACEAHGLGVHTEAIEALARPAVRLETKRADDAPIPIGATKLGGDADVREGFEWPRRKGRPLTFIGQIDCAEAGPLLGADADLLPQAGLLSFFYDAFEQPWGFSPDDRDSSLIVHFAPGTPLRRTAAPPGEQPTDRVTGFRSQLGLVRSAESEIRADPCAVSMRSIISWPGWESLPIEALGIDRHAYFNVEEAIANAPGAHQLLGWPYEIQGEMQLQCARCFAGLPRAPIPNPFADEPEEPQPEPHELAARRAAAREQAPTWRLLLQIDSDDNLGAMWGDLGRIYFWVREPSLRDRSFREAWTILQCH